MIKSKKFLQLLSLALTITSVFTSARIKLSDLNYKSASVLPYYHHKKTRWAILPREGFGRDKGTCDDFGGSRDKGENHPVVSAAREFHEEAIADKTIGLTLRQTISFLNKDSKYIVSYSDKRGTCNVTYITNFDKYKNQFFKNFYTARNNATSFQNKEKDRIVVVSWQNLKNAVTQNGYVIGNWLRSFFKPKTQGITVAALEQDPHTGKFRPTTVTLRPFFVKKMRSFFLDKPYQQGMNKRIRHYSE